MTTAGRAHPFADRWNHNSHYYPRLATALATTSGPVLDVGCGDGTLCEFLAAQDRQVIGVDLDPVVLTGDSSRASYVVGSAEALPLADATCGAVVLVMALHHVAAARGIAEAVRVLAPGGRLLVLGYGRFGGLRDVPAELRDLVAHRALSRGRTVWDPPTGKAGPAATWAEERARALRLLPGCTWRRLPLWRYLMTWDKPG